MKRLLPLVLSATILCVSAVAVANDLEDILKTVGRAIRRADSPSEDLHGKTAFVRGGNVWIAEADGSRARALTTTRDCAWPVWSSDGRAIVYRRLLKNGCAIWLYDLTVGAAKRLVSHSMSSGSASISPDGQTLACTLERMSRGEVPAFDLVLLDIQSGRRRVYKRDVCGEVDWLPDGRLVYTVFERSGAIAVGDIDAKEERVVYRMRNRDTPDHHVDLFDSNRGRIVFLESPRSVEDLGYDIKVLNVQSGATSILASGSMAYGRASLCLINGSLENYWLAYNNYENPPKMTLYLRGREARTILGDQPSWSK